MSPIKVIIIGSGLGGLCLAQSLRGNANVTVSIFERDKSPWDRPQGYRLHLDSDGIMALHRALTPELYGLFDATSMRAIDATTIVDTNLNVLRRLPSDEHGGSKAHATPGLATHVNVNRATLREILLTGLADRLHFGKKFTGYQSDAAGVTAFFDDGTTVHGDVLVGADGIRSAVRAQRVPEARTQDTGVRAIYGRIPIGSARSVVPAQALADVFTTAVGPQKVFLGLGPVLFPQRPDEAAKAVSLAALAPQSDYVVSVLGGRKELLGVSDDVFRLMGSRALQALALQLVQQWPEAARAIVTHGDPDSYFAVEMYTSVPCTMPAHDRVTLLGDAIHAMTPTLGRGANVAMRDGAMLGQTLAAVASGEHALAGALATYEGAMTAYGFDVVRKSAALGERLIGQDPLPERSL